MKRHHFYKRQSRRGAITVLAAIMSDALIGMVAFCVDIGYELTAKEELQRSADASALATGWEYGKQLGKGATSTAAMASTRSTASFYTSLNKVTSSGMSLNTNASNDPGV